MSDTQLPKALQLAEQCQCIGELARWPQLLGAADELRRLHAINEELLAALARYVQQDMAHGMTDNNLHRTARAAIAKATGEQK